MKRKPLEQTSFKVFYFMGLPCHSLVIFFWSIVMTHASLLHAWLCQTGCTVRHFLDSTHCRTSSNPPEHSTATGQSAPRTFYDHVEGQFLVNAHHHMLTLQPSVLKVRQFLLVVSKKKKSATFKVLRTWCKWNVHMNFVLLQGPSSGQCIRILTSFVLHSSILDYINLKMLLLWL